MRRRDWPASPCTHWYLQMNFLIVSKQRDVHAVAVAAALRVCGHEAVHYSYPSKIGIPDVTLEIGGDGDQWIMNGRVFSSTHFASIWLRRRRMPDMTAAIHPDDKLFVFRENRAFYSGIWSLGNRSRVIHDYGSVANGEDKIRQLCLAKDVGFAVPRTMISSCKEKIIEFIRSAKAVQKDVMYKTFSSISWDEGETTRVKHTVVVDEAAICDNPVVELTPGIYQHRVDKAYEVRANIFGNECISARIDACSDTRGTDDWRSVLDLRGRVQAHTLPSAVYEKCLHLLRRLGLQMACFDFIVDSDGHYTFVELNQQGQFLWLEELCSEMHLLESFLRFFTGDPSSIGRVRLQDILISEEYLALRNKHFSSPLATAHDL